MSKLLKDLYDENYVNLLANNLSNHYGGFDKDSFVSAVFNKDWKNKELKQRMRHISFTLAHFLPKSYKKAIDILKNTFLNMNAQYSLENMIFQDFVEVYGMDDFDISMDALACFTISSSSEFAIRRFILKYPEMTMVQMRVWAKYENEHLRRLSSEGCRARLPWAIALPLFKKNPQEILEILEMLKDDESLYVRKSVANSLNDISKDNPQLLKEITKKWIGVNKNRDWILKYGCRTLLKSGDTYILDLFGFKANNSISINDFRVDANVEIGKNLEFSFSLVSPEKLGKLRIEFAMHFLRQNNKYSRKVFKIAEGVYDETTKSISKYYSFKPISTRKYYKGKHILEIIVNGLSLQSRDFTFDKAL